MRAPVRKASHGLFLSSARLKTQSDNATKKVERTSGKTVGMYIVVRGKTAASGAASEATRSLKHRRVRKKMRTTVRR